MHTSSHIYSPDAISVFDKRFKKMLSEEVIFDRVQTLGKLITADYEGKKPVFLIVLNGSFIFAADLIRACHLECETAFIKISSYKGMHSTGKVKTAMDFTIDVSGRDVIIVEDIIDTGTTMQHFLHALATLRPISIAIATLLLKPEAIQYKVPVHYCGFEIENKFVIGYGLDFNEIGRNLAAIYQIDV